MKILVVDDSRDFQLLIDKLLGKAGYKSILFASSAGEAFDMLGLGGAKGTSGEISLILMDILMPGMDGITACRRIKSDPAYHDTPLIIVTVVDEMHRLKEAFEAGANDYITKPTNEIEIIARIRSAVALKEEMDCRKAQANELKKLAFAVEQSPASIMIANNKGCIEYVNRAFTDATGYSMEELYGKSAEILVSDKHTPEFSRELQAVTSAGKVWHGDICSIKKNGKPLWELRTISPLMGLDGKMTHFVSVKIDDTERRVAEKALKQKNEELELLSMELHNLTLELSSLEERQRKKFAGMLHEEIGQNLVTIELSCEKMSSGLEISSAERQEMAKRIGMLLKSTINTVRTFTSKLYLSVPKGTRIEDAIRWYGINSFNNTDTNLLLNLDERLESLPNKVKDCLLHIVREAFQNTMKHASAKKVEVSCFIVEESVSLKISDDGKGSTSIPDKKNRGIGLLLMREMVKSLDGEIKITSNPNEGTHVNVVLTIPK